MCPGASDDPGNGSGLIAAVFKAIVLLRLLSFAWTEDGDRVILRASLK